MKLVRWAPVGVLLTALVATLVAALVSGCGPASSTSTGSSPASAQASASGAPTSPVEGIVLTIDSSGLTQVHGFTLRTADGQVMTFTIGQLDNPTQFPPGHLAEHQASTLPVRVFFRISGGSLVVYRIEDASG